MLYVKEISRVKNDAIDQAAEKHVINEVEWSENFTYSKRSVDPMYITSTLLHKTNQRKCKGPNTDKF